MNVFFQPTTHNPSFLELIRDENGNYCTSYYDNLVFENVLSTKAWALLHGVWMPRNMDLKNVLFENEYKPLINMVRDVFSTLSRLQPILKEVHCLFHLHD